MSGGSPLLIGSGRSRSTGPPSRIAAPTSRSACDLDVAVLRRRARDGAADKPPRRRGHLAYRSQTASRLRFDGSFATEIFRTNCSDGARVSAEAAGRFGVGWVDFGKSEPTVPRKLLRRAGADWRGKPLFTKRRPLSRGTSPRRRAMGAGGTRGRSARPWRSRSGRRRGGGPDRPPGTRPAAGRREP